MSIKILILEIHCDVLGCNNRTNGTIEGVKNLGWKFSLPQFQDAGVHWCPECAKKLEEQKKQ